MPGVDCVRKYLGMDGTPVGTWGGDKSRKGGLSTGLLRMMTGLARVSGGLLQAPSVELLGGALPADAADITGFFLRSLACFMSSTREPEPEEEEEELEKPTRCFSLL